MVSLVKTMMAYRDKAVLQFMLTEVYVKKFLALPKVESDELSF